MTRRRLVAVALGFVPLAVLAGLPLVRDRRAPEKRRTSVLLVTSTRCGTTASAATVRAP